MAHGIIRVRNLSAGKVENTETHNERMYEKRGIDIPENIRQEESHRNISYVRGMEEFSKPGDETISYQEAIENRFQEAGVTPRKNSVNAIEFMISATDDFFEEWTDPKTGKKYNAYSADVYLFNSVHWLEDRYGKENVVAWSIHFDENTPHVHAIVTPIQEKEVKWKNRNGEGVKKENRLVARDITGGPDLLRKLQDDFFEHVSTQYDGFANWYRGTLVEHQLKHYTKKTNHEIGQLRKELNSMQHDAEAVLRILKKIEEKQKEMEKETNRLQQQVEIRKARNKSEGWKKGKEFAHGEPLLEKKEKLVEKPDLTKQEKPKKGHGFGM